MLNPPEPQRHLIEPTRGEARPEVPEPGGEYLCDRQPDIRTRLIQHKHLDADRLDRFLAAQDARANVAVADGERATPAGRREGVGSEVRLALDRRRRIPLVERQIARYT